MFNRPKRTYARAPRLRTLKSRCKKLTKRLANYYVKKTGPGVAASIVPKKGYVLACANNPTATGAYRYGVFPSKQIAKAEAWLLKVGGGNVVGTPSAVATGTTNKRTREDAGI